MREPPRPPPAQTLVGWQCDGDSAMQTELNMATNSNQHTKTQTKTSGQPILHCATALNINNASAAFKLLSVELLVGTCKRD